VVEFAHLEHFGLIDCLTQKAETNRDYNFEANHDLEGKRKLDRIRCLKYKIKNKDCAIEVGKEKKRKEKRRKKRKKRIMRRNLGDWIE
jgi:hypothetical protein